MKQKFLLLSLLGIFAFTPAVLLVEGINETRASELSSNIMRRVNAANEYLNKAEEQIGAGRSEHAPRQVAGAQKEYDNIFNYYSGSFDPNHQTLVTLKSRIDKVNAALSAPPPSTASAQHQPVPAAQSGSVSTSQTQTSTSVRTTPVTTQKPLSSNIKRRLAKANNDLSYVFERAAKGEDASLSLNEAQKEYNNIFTYYKGSFDPDHPDIVALKNRIADAEKAMSEGIAQKNAELNIESNSRVVKDLPPDTGKALLNLGGLLARLENLLSTARSSQNPGNYVPGLQSSLADAKNRMDQFNTDFSGKFSPNHVAYQQVMRRLRDASSAVFQIEAKASSIASAQKAEVAAKYNEKARQIMNTYRNQDPTSELHRKNIGRMVWSSTPINFKEQDKIALKTTFKLVEPIFGRLYLARSLGNTPVYSSGDDTRPSENYQFRYAYRLFIDGQEKVDKYGVFLEGKLKGKAGENWTTFQFAPHPVPYDKDFRNEAEAWRRVTKGLSPGTHNVRFELWGKQGQFLSLEPISVGEFTLIVGEGERVAAGMKFPGDSYPGNDVNKVRSDMLKALVGPVAKSRGEILKISVTSDWRPGVYTDTKRPYRVIRGTVLWHDTNNDNVCRFTTVNFISDNLGGQSWTPVRYRSLSAGSEGDTECP